MCTKSASSSLCVCQNSHDIGFALTHQVAVTYTIPWDSFLIRNQIWSYPSHVIIGPKLFDIPLEEVFFFVVQTYNTSLLYLILSKPTFQPVYLRAERGWNSTLEKSPSGWRQVKILGHVLLAAITACGWHFVRRGGLATYTGLILVWATPVLWLLWYGFYSTSGLSTR